jgi:hypothetical protein
MSTNSVSVWGTSLFALLVLGPVRATESHGPARLTLDLATLHAAALTTSRGTADSSDDPYLLISVVGSAGGRETHELPTAGHWAVHQDQAIGKTPITTLSLQSGDSVRVLLTVLADRAASSQELPVATAETALLADQRSLASPPAEAVVTPALAPLTSGGAHWLGSASLLLINEGGTAYWTRLDCIATCKVLASPVAADGAGTPLEATTPRAAAGVVELSGGSGTYHLQVTVRREP